MMQKPLMLKDFLELDPCESPASFRYAPRCAPMYWEQNWSDSSNSSFSSVRSCSSSGSDAKLMRTRSMKAVEKLSAVMTALKFLFSSSKKLKKSFSKKSSSGNVEETKVEQVEILRGRSVRVKDILQFGSFVERAMECCPPSPVISSITTSTSSFSDHSRSSEYVKSSPGSSSECGDGVGDKTRENSQAVTLLHQQEEAKGLESVGSPCSRCQLEEEKEQRSPVSVMDFPFQDDDHEEDESSEVAAPCFQQNLSNVERTTCQLLQKIQCFESLAEFVPLYLEPTFAAVKDHSELSDHEELLPKEQEQEALAEEQDEIEKLDRRAKELLNQLGFNSILEPHNKILLLDFFIDGLWNSTQCSKNMDDEQQLLMAATKWMKDEYMTVDEGCEKVCFKEKDGSWMCLADEKEGLDKEVDEILLDSLLDELILELTMS